MFLVPLALAQEGPPLEWSPIVELRARALGDAGADSSASASDGDSLTVGQRARLGIEVSRGILSARVSFQEIRTWTRADSIVAGPFSAHVAEGWARIGGSLTPSLEGQLTIGRQPIVIDDGRIVGERAWELGGQFLDAMRAQASLAPFEFEFVNARRFDDEVLPDGTVEDPLGFGVNVLRAGLGKEGAITRWKVDALSVVDARNTVDTTTTLGLYGRLWDGRWRVTAEIYVQQNPLGTATLGAVEAGWVLGPDEGFTVRSSLTVESGDPDGSGPLSPWAPVLGDTHRFLGLCDRFATAPTLGDVPGDGGVIGGAVAIDSRPGRALRASVSGVHFLSPVTGLRYGEELDLTGRWAFTPFGALDVGWGHFFANDAWESGDVDFGYVDLDVRF